MDNDLPQPYTFAGRLLLLFTIVIPICATWWTIYLLAESLPSGRYPLVFFAMPYVAVAFLLFFGGSALLRKLGVRVRKDDTTSADGVVSPAKGSKSQTESMNTPTTGFCSDCDKEVLVDDGRCRECHWPI